MMMEILFNYIRAETRNGERLNMNMKQIRNYTSWYNMHEIYFNFHMDFHSFNIYMHSLFQFNVQHLIFLQFIHSWLPSTDQRNEAMDIMWFHFSFMRFSHYLKPSTILIFTVKQSTYEWKIKNYFDSKIFIRSRHWIIKWKSFNGNKSQPEKNGKNLSSILK